MFVDVTAYNSKNYYIQGEVVIPGKLPVTGKRDHPGCHQLRGRPESSGGPQKCVLYRQPSQRAGCSSRCPSTSTRSHWETIFRRIISSCPAIAWSFRATRASSRKHRKPRRDIRRSRPHRQSVDASLYFDRSPENSEHANARNPQRSAICRSDDRSVLAPSGGPVERPRAKARPDPRSTQDAHALTDLADISEPDPIPLAPTLATLVTSGRWRFDRPSSHE